MCTNPFSYQLEDSLPYSFENIKRRWENIRLKSKDSICLTGGEPTIHPDFFNITSWFRKKFPENQIALATNGRMFCYSDFTKKLFKINDLVVEIALHGYNVQSHDMITRVPHSFEQTVKGIHNILKYKNDSQNIEIRIIITKLTYRNLDKILAFIYQEFNISKIRDVVLIFLEMEGQAKDNFDLVKITYKEVMKTLPVVVTKWASYFNDFRLYHFPLCVLPHNLRQYAWSTLRGDEIIFLPCCKDCALRRKCVGIHRDYYTLIGQKEFKKVSRKIQSK